jgi:ABC-type nickel/cobalt efflux system permease component RcnA
VEQLIARQKWLYTGVMDAFDATRAAGAGEIMIALVGLWLLWRAFRQRGHATARSGPVLGLVGGLVPCPLTTFVMTYAVIRVQRASACSCRRPSPPA